MRQRAAWSLSNVISALCEHDDKDGVAPAVALQGLAVATCATVRKCLNDNDKVPVFLYFQHLCLQFYIRFTSLHSHLYIRFFTVAFACMHSCSPRCFGIGSILWNPMCWNAWATCPKMQCLFRASVGSSMERYSIQCLRLPLVIS